MITFLKCALINNPLKILTKNCLIAKKLTNGKETVDDTMRNVFQIENVK